MPKNVTSWRHHCDIILNDVRHSTIATFIAEEQRAYIKIEFYKGSSSTESFSTLHVQNLCEE